MTLEVDAGPKITDYIMEIAEEMKSRFSITNEEAISRINRHWRGVVLDDDDTFLFREDTEFWAKTIYYGPGVNWWNLPEDELRPRDYER